MFPLKRRRPGRILSKLTLTQHRDGSSLFPPNHRRVLKFLCRATFIHNSIEHLYATTYEPSDELTLATLLVYLNSAAPPDKHEDFDTAEVLDAVKSLKGSGILNLEGDVLRLT